MGSPSAVADGLGRCTCLSDELRPHHDHNVIERCFNRLKQFRAISTRFDKFADRYRAGIVLASRSSGSANQPDDHLPDRPE